MTARVSRAPWRAAWAVAQAVARVVASGLMAAGLLVAAPAVLAADAAGVVPGSAPAAALTLEQIMADPDWIGAPVRGAYWSVDGRSAYYSQKHSGSPWMDLHRVAATGGGDRLIDGPAMAGAEGPAVFDRSGRRAAFVRNGDVFLRGVSSGSASGAAGGVHGAGGAAGMQVTRAAQSASAPQFSLDGRLLSFRVGLDWFVHDVASGVTAPATVLKLEKDPNEAPKPDDLRDFQLRTFTTLKKQHDDLERSRKHGEQAQREDPTRVAPPYYLGDEVKILDTSLSPDARWLAVVTEPKSAPAGFEGKLTRYVTESGYEEFEKERVRVGRNPPAAQSLWLLDLVNHTIHAVPLDGLPGMHDDPLQAVREENHLPDPAAKDAERKPRGVLIKPDDPDGAAGGFAWSGDGRNLAVELRSIDNKDRWIASMDFEHHALVARHRLHDAAWVGWQFHDFGWLNDNATLWYQSEESGFAHLYAMAPGEPARALTSGRFEVSKPVLSADGRWFYVLANAQAPYSYDVYRVPSAGGALQRMTHLEGVEEFALDHAAAQILVTHSSPYIPSQLAVVKTDGRSVARELTDTRSAAYRAVSWVEPQIVAVPSSTQTGGVIYAKVYGGTAGVGRPGVLFVHGAGYMQNVHRRFPYYFREQMFNNLLVQRGYVVIDMDYRASAGYGRDWRTAIYRQMGHPELDDLLDGKRWLVTHAGVDPKRVGLYGGSYGGFMTLMALFRAPGEFGAGAALRPVTDWMQYDRDYTSNILNDPQVDPLAYARSSPLEFAAGLRDPLLICHGVIDDNVLFEDSMRLYQRLIELHKDDFTLSPYPLDRHGFANADSWLDEYKRVLRLFETTLRR